MVWEDYYNSMIYPKSFENLVDSFEKLPGIGEKTAERFVFSLLKWDTDEVENFSYNISNIKNKIKKCSICGHICEEDICGICSDPTRDKTVICVVEDSKKVFMLEKTRSYNGLYHVLGGLISPIDDINPEDINISNLINKRINDNLKEIIIALNSSVEGETTSLYLQKILKNKNVNLSRLSYGIPLGSDLEFIDPLVIEKAIEDRKKVEY